MSYHLPDESACRQLTPRFFPAGQRLQRRHVPVESIERKWCRGVFPIEKCLTLGLMVLAWTG